MAEMEGLNIIQRRSNPLDVMGSCGTQDDTAPLSVMNCLRKNDIAFFDRVPVGSNGETNSLDGVTSTERAAHLRKRTVRTGQRTRSGRSPTKSARD